MIADYTGSQREAIKQAIANQAAVLDVGCGDGAKTHFISQYVKHSVGVDPDKKLIQFAKRKYSANSIKYHCHGLDDLLQYSSMPELDPHQSEGFKKEALQRLERCVRNSQGDFTLDYSATVWNLVKT